MPILKLSSAGADGMLNGTSIGAQCNTGYIRIYSGTMPTTANAALSGNTMLAEARFAATAFGTPAAGTGTDRQITAAAIAAVTAAAGDGSNPATFFRAFRTDGTTVVFQGDAGTTTQTMVLNAANIIQGGNVTISSVILTLPTE